MSAFGTKRTCDADADECPLSGEKRTSAEFARCPLMTQSGHYRDCQIAPSGRGLGSLRLVAHGTEFGSSQLCNARRSGGRIQGEL